ncbi:hypothetical protein QQS21_002698 [Conoideocrella luteorostrata]|uniref:F-box domain-containing protein n=1 Tax=Conoideocrella luteorostrata TaxID=1105319 RepID=A0AAJ0CX50_9HYPO|nr:hypothetical protein QQS21_002698 [Conoideocrella luteorostrata]
MAHCASTALPGTRPIQTIPVEVLLRISYHLPTPDLGALRLTCRSVEQSLYTTFVSEFFTRKKFMITQDSLQTLIDISKSRLSRHLRDVHIGLDRFPEGSTRPLSDEVKEAKFRQRFADNFTLWNTGHHRDMMAEAFRNLENLTTIVIRDFNSRRRSRDGDSAEWHSYGYTTIFNETGVSLNQGMTGVWNSGLPNQYGSQVFAAVIFALGAANAKPKGIEIMSRNNNEMRDFAFNIPAYLQSSVVPILQGLEKLHLSIDLAWRCCNLGWSAHAPGVTRAAPDLLIRQFLAHTTNLKDLRINEHKTNNAGLIDLLDWMVGDGGDSSSQSKSTQDAPVISMPHLEKLSLGAMSVDAPRLLKLVKKFASSLKSLELWKVTMTRNMPPMARTPAPKEIFWAFFFKKLIEIPGLDLKHFKAGMLQQHWVEKPVPIHVSFKGHGPTREYFGSNCKDFIGEIKELLEAQWPDDNHHHQHHHQFLHGDPEFQSKVPSSQFTSE